MKKLNTKQAGFSLLEIMVVIMIIGGMAALIVPNLIGNKGRADVQKVKSDIVALENALGMYNLDNSTYPTTDQGLEALVSEPDSSPAPRNYREGGYIKRLPQDPWGNDYILNNPGENSKIDVLSVGLDGEEGTEDDIGNWNLNDK
ncbi:type II secretion system major pseudopilin GspG [Psychromonas algicola]|uniref:type II secretion system major pseudopilin GspG n=1 Tax=Psychromonas algicola TaxID=2555642 RepID=UPI001068B366|nr:type II secretion system major pseudopilin GspG [Psychromonas sp. RZ5]TEW52696.1 type II secretion system protein GspG [Psychromonas sp. RZ5]